MKVYTGSDEEKERKSVSEKFTSRSYLQNRLQAQDSIHFVVWEGTVWS